MRIKQCEIHQWTSRGGEIKMSNLCPARYGFRPKPMLIVCIFSPIRFQSNTFLYDKFHRGKKKKKMTTQPRRPYEKFHSLWFFFFFYWISQLRYIATDSSYWFSRPRPSSHGIYPRRRRILTYTLLATVIFSIQFYGY